VGWNFYTKQNFGDASDRSNELWIMSKTFEIHYIVDFKPTLQIGGRQDNLLVKNRSTLKYSTIFSHLIQNHLSPPCKSSQTQNLLMRF